MATRTVTIEFPEELAALLGPVESLPDTVLETVVLELLRDARISQGRAEMLLGLTMREILQLKAQNCVPSGPETAEETQRDIEAAMRGAVTTAKKW